VTYLGQRRSTRASTTFDDVGGSVVARIERWVGQGPNT
jgi:hypothetical protein